MRITKFSDYSLRVLMFLASKPSGELSTIHEISTQFNISIDNMRKVVHNLGLLGYIESIQGKGGGFKLNQPAKNITLGSVVKKTENDFYLVDCFNPEGSCPITSMCKLVKIMHDSLNRFTEELDKYTLADIASTDFIELPFTQLKSV